MPVNVSYPEVCHGFDLDIGLRDAACDANVVPVRRAIANLSIGMDVDDAYYSVRELREAMVMVFEGSPKGREKLASVLAAACDDFQRAIYYALAGRGIGDALEALDWLLAILKARGKLAASLSRQRIYRRALISPYVSEEPEGPLVSPDRGFELGKSWSVERGPGPY